MSPTPILPLLVLFTNEKILVQYFLIVLLKDELRYNFLYPPSLLYADLTLTFIKEPKHHDHDDNESDLQPVANQGHRLGLQRPHQLRHGSALSHPFVMLYGSGAEV